MTAPAFGQAIRVDRFGGLNDTDPAATLQDYQAQDAINVEASLAGEALLKRKGYSRQATLTLSSAPINGSFYFVDGNGNNQAIVCHDKYCSKSTNGAAFSVWLSTGGGLSCVPRRWTFGSVNGKLYGANDCRDNILQFDGTTLTYPTTMYAGSVLELTKDRLVIADVAASPNSVYYSQSGVYTNFVAGINSADPYVDAIGSPGDRTTALKFSLGKLFIFKASSITSCLLKDQYSSSCAPVSNSIGTQDPLSVVEIPGAILFRGQDRNYWRLDNSGLTLMSRPISGLVSSQTSGSVQSNTQTSQSDWQAGTQSPSGSWNTTAVNGSILPSSVTFIDDAAVDFASGSLVNVSTRDISGSVTLYRDTFSVTNGGFEDGTTGNWTTAGTVVVNHSLSTPLFAACGADGNETASYNVLLAGCRTGTPGFSPTYDLTVQDTAGNPIKGCSVSYSCNSSGSCSYVSDTCDARQTETTVNYGIFSLDTSTLTQTGFKVKFYDELSGASVTSSTGAPSKQVVFRIHGNAGGTTCTSGNGSSPGFDTCANANYVFSGTFTSRAFDTTFSTPTWGVFQSTYVALSTNAAVTFGVQVATSTNGVWDSTVAVTTDGRILTNQKRAARYSAVITNLQTSTRTANVEIRSVSLNAATTGLYQTQCIQPGSNVTAWGIISCAQTLAGNGSLVIYSTTAYSCAAISTAPVTQWPQQTNNATLTNGVSVSSAVVIGFRSLLGSATDQAQIDSCSLYWNNGTVAPPVWGTYDSLKNAVYWTSSINNSSTNNRVLKYDLNLGEWFPLGLNANAVRFIQGATYFGDSTGGFWNQYGGVDSDNGSAINAYWKSKDFGGGAPFQEKQFNRVSIVTKNQSQGSLTATYSLRNNDYSGSYSISLTTASASTYVRANYSLPLMSPALFFNLKLGNNSAVPFEIDGAQIDFTTLPWKPQNP